MDKNSQNLIIQARKLIRNQKKGVLSTTGGGSNFDEGQPLGSLVTYVPAWDGSPIFCSLRFLSIQRILSMMIEYVCWLMALITLLIRKRVPE